MSGFPEKFSDGKKMSVLHVALNPVTGPWSVMWNLALAQARSGRYGAVGMGVVHSAKWPAAYDEELKNLGLPFFKAATLECFGTAQFLWQRIQRPPVGNWAQQLAAAGGTDSVVVHFHNAWMSGVFLPLRPPPKIKIRFVATVHGVNAELAGRPARRWLHRRMAARLPRHGVRLTSVDRGNLPLAEKILGLDAKLFAPVANGVPDDPEARSTPWNGAGEFVVGHIGSISEQKGWRLAADAVMKLRRQGLPISLLVAGAGPEADAAREIAKASGGGVEFLGHVPNPRKKLLPRLHALAVMSRHEGLPMTIIEAMAAGVPVVATAVGGIPEAIEQNKSGLLVPRSADDLASALQRLHGSPDLCRALGAAARERFERQFEISQIVRAYHAVYAGEV